MILPFNAEQFLAVFTAYNVAIWPVQPVAYGLGLLALLALMLRPPRGDRVILVVLAAMWAWNGFAYHFAFFSSINVAAFGFAFLFVFQAVLFAYHAWNLNDLKFEARGNWRSMIAFSLVIYAMLIYQVLGIIAGHRLMSGPLFGVAPCPTTIFTIGLLLLADGRLVRRLAVIPVLWAVVGRALRCCFPFPRISVSESQASYLSCRRLWRRLPTDLMLDKSTP